MSEPATFTTLRHPFQTQPDLQLTPIEKIHRPLTSRDERPPLRAGLQWRWRHPTLTAELCARLAAKILAGPKSTSRTGRDRWQILVLGVGPLGLDAAWDRREPIANCDALLPQRLGVPAPPSGTDEKRFGQQTRRDNVPRRDDELLQAITTRLAAAGRRVFAKKRRRARCGA